MKEARAIRSGIEPVIRHLNQRKELCASGGAKRLECGVFSAAVPKPAATNSMAPLPASQSGDQSPQSKRFASTLVSTFSKNLWPLAGAGAFSLTLPSPAGRGNTGGSFQIFRTAFPPIPRPNLQLRRRMILPLPAGEGWGEGEGFALTKGLRFNLNGSSHRRVPGGGNSLAASSSTSTQSSISPGFGGANSRSPLSS